MPAEGHLPRVVLVTGVSRYLGGRVATLLQADPAIERVIGVDTVPPRQDLGRTEFVRADIRNPLIAKVVSAAAVDTVCHLNVVAAPLGAGGRSSMKETNVIGTMQLLAACQKAASVRKLVVKSTSSVYGMSPSDPALFTEETEPRAMPSSGYAKDATEIEGYVRGFGRRRPDVELSVLRLVDVIGPRIDSPLARYFALPVVPTVLGHDPRLQLLHTDDAVEVLRRATLEPHPGVYNVAGQGVLTVTQAARRAGRPTVAVPAQAVSGAARAFRRAGLVDFSPEQLGFLRHGRVVDITRLTDVFGYRPAYTTAEAFADYVQGRGLRRLLPVGAVDAVGRVAVGVTERARVLL